MNHKVNYQYNEGMVDFANGVRISESELNAIFRLKNKTTCIHSFLWMELLRIPEGENSISVNFNIRNFNRLRDPITILTASGFFKIQTNEFIENNLSRIKVCFSEIHPDFRSIIPLI